ncbi:uncharacterized, partial [Tachysurus ichikawai]
MEDYIHSRGENPVCCYGDSCRSHFEACLR